MAYNRSRLPRFSGLRLAIVLLSATVVAFGVIGGLLNQVSARDDVYRDLSIFTDVLNKVREDYVEEPDIERAMHGAILGMIESLDPYSSFVSQATYQRLKALDPETAASPGVLLSKRYGYAYVVSVVPGSPAEREGLRSGDLLESMAGAVTTHMSLWEAQRALLGAAGTSIDVRVVRARRTEASDITLVREELPALEVSARIVEESIGRVRIPHFREGVAEAVRAKVRMLQSSGIRGIVLDVRGTAAGTLEEAVRTAEFFVPKGRLIVTVQDREGKEVSYTSMEEPGIGDVILVVLADGGTSGPAEVFTTALQDHGLARLVGEKTNGFGSIQEEYTLEDGAVLILSAQLFYRPNGEPIQDRNLRGSGASPDVRSPDEDFVTGFYIENTPEDIEGVLGEEFYRKLNDAIETEQEERALKELRSLIAERKAA